MADKPPRKGNERPPEPFVAADVFGATPRHRESSRQINLRVPAGSAKLLERARQDDKFDTVQNYIVSLINADLRKKYPKEF